MPTIRTDQIARGLLDCQADSVKFVRAWLNAEPDPWQAEALRAIDAGEHVAIRSGHGVGKTAMLSWAMLQTVACYPYSKTPCTAPTQHQLSDLLWAEASRWLNRSPLRGWLEWTATKVAPRGEESWFAVARACSDANNLAGFHAPKLRYIVDEAAGVPDSIFEVIDGALTTPGSQLIMAGNPTQLSGAFHAAFHKNRARYRLMHISSLDSHRVSPDYAVTMAAKWGIDSDIYRVRVLGEFPQAETESFISLPLVEAAVQRGYEPGGEEGTCEIGLDVARFGDDETVFAIRKGGRILPLECYRGKDTTWTVGRAIQLIGEHGAKTIKVDDTGVGGGVTDQLKEASGQERLHGCAISAMNFGGAGDDDYSNAVSVWYGVMKNMLRQGEMALPDDEELIAQLTTRRYTITSRGTIQIEPKPDMKRRGLPSPDRAEAVALAVAPTNTEVAIISLDADTSSRELNRDDERWWH